MVVCPGCISKYYKVSSKQTFNGITDMVDIYGGVARLTAAIVDRSDNKDPVTKPELASFGELASILQRMLPESERTLGPRPGAPAATSEPTASAPATPAAEEPPSAERVPPAP